jgi:hypothetical protein
MTDITNTTPISLRRLSLPRLELPKLGIGTAVSVMSEAVMRAFEMAYVAPFSAMQRKPSIVFDEDLEGRDPNW